MKSKPLVGSIIVWVVVFLAITLVPEDTFNFPKGTTYLVLSIPMIINFAVIVFTRICPNCRSWMTFINKRRCSVCGTELH